MASDLDPDRARAYKRAMLGRLARHSFIGALMLITAPACAGAAQQLPLSIQGPDVTAGWVQVERIEGGLGLVVIELQPSGRDLQISENMSFLSSMAAAEQRPGRADPVWMVWLQTPEQRAPVRAGVLRYDPVAGAARLMTTVSAGHFMVRITEEPHERVEHPSPRLVAQQAIAFN